MGGLHIKVESFLDVPCAAWRSVLPINVDLYMPCTRVETYGVAGGTNYVKS